MKHKFAACRTALVAIAVLAIPGALMAQRTKAQHHHYKLIDLGTLGGQNRYVPWRGEHYEWRHAAGDADTSIADLYYPNLNPFLSGGLSVRIRMSTTPLEPMGAS